MGSISNGLICGNGAVVTTTSIEYLAELGELEDDSWVRIAGRWIQVLHQEGTA